MTGRRIVADYFAMLADDIAGRPYSKTEHNRTLQAKARPIASWQPIAPVARRR